jgi:hypothetical protein
MLTRREFIGAAIGATAAAHAVRTSSRSVSLVD